MLTLYLDEEIKKICPIEGISVGRKNDKNTWKIDFASNATLEQIEAANTFVENFDINNFLILQAKKDKNLKIDEKTQQIIAQGFPFASKRFSLSQNAQTNWTNMYINKSILSKPLTVTTNDDEAFQLETESDIQNFYMTGLVYVQSIINSGRALKLSVNNCSTLEEIENIVDER